MTDLTELTGVYRRAAHIIQTNGHNRGDYVPDPFGHVIQTPLPSRPMSLPAAVYCAAEPTGDMYVTALAEAALVDLAGRVLVDGEGPWDPARAVDCELHLSAWNREAGRTRAEVVRLLLDAADGLERAGHASLVPVGLRTGDGSVWELASVAADGTPHYVLAGCHGAPEGVFADGRELVERFGAVSASAGAA